MALGRSPEYHWNQNYSTYLTLQGHNLNKLCRVCVFKATGVYHFTGLAEEDV